MSTDPSMMARILGESRTIAVVGLSADPDKPSHEVASYLQAQGYRIVPVNPKGGVILGEQVYPELAAVPFPIDVVDVFRPPAACPDVARQAVAIKARVLWLQLGIASVEAERIANEGGLEVVMDRCMLIEHRRLPGA